MSRGSWSALKFPLSKAFKVAVAVAVVIVSLEILFLIIWGAAIWVDGTVLD